MLKCIVVVVFAATAYCNCNITMRSAICFLFTACVVYWLPSNAASAGNTLTTDYHGNGVATAPGVPELPIITLQRFVRSSWRHPHTSRGAPALAKMSAKRTMFWKGNKGGPLPVDEIPGRQNYGELSGDLGQSHKAMRYG